MIHVLHSRWLLLLLAGALAGCASPRTGNEVLGQINDVLLKSAAERKAPSAALNDKSLMPPLAPQAAADPAAAAEPRFDLSVVNAPATQVFMALVSGTRYSMLLPPDVAGSLTVNLKDVTVMEALDTIRELYGYEYRVQGKRIFIEPNTMKTRVFHINYLASRRQGSSDLRVAGGSIAPTSATGSTSASTPTAAAPAAGGAAAGGAAAGRSSDTSRVSMTTDSDFWGDLNRALASIVGNTEGRSVVVNPSSGVVLVRALPTELGNVEKYLKATQLIAERQVMLEAKIIDVTLSDDFQAGVNWGAFGRGPNSRSAIGLAQPGATVGVGSAAQTIGSATTPTLSVTPGQAGSIAASVLGRGFVGLALQTANFAALLNFLETQGSVTVLSSPRIATLNNQKAVLKVGTDEFFVTDLSVSAGTTTAAGTTGPATITPQFRSMFSGISLDVTPQIDEDGNIILHVHPAVTTISESQKSIDLGGATGVISVPLAVSRINETDSIVRVQDGNIVAIGGLMRQAQSSDRSQLPGAAGFAANALGQRASSLSKRELVILIKPTLIDGDRVWTQDIKDVGERVRAFPSVRE